MAAVRDIVTPCRSGGNAKDAAGPVRLRVLRFEGEPSTHSEGGTLITKYAVFGTLLLALTGGTVVFAIRAIRLIEFDGHADRKTVWRLATLRALTAIAGLSGGLSVFLTFGLVLGEIAGVLSPVALWSSPRPSDLLLFAMASLFIFGGAYCGIAFAIGNDGRKTWRSFTVLRRLTVISRKTSSAFRRLVPVAAVIALAKKYDRPLW